MRVKERYRLEVSVELAENTRVSAASVVFDFWIQQFPLGVNCDAVCVEPRNRA